MTVPEAIWLATNKLAVLLLTTENQVSACQHNAELYLSPLKSGSEQKGTLTQARCFHTTKAVFKVNPPNLYKSSMQ